MALFPRPDKIPEWARDDQLDPSIGVNNVVEPPAGKKQYGWFFKEAPPMNWFNWLQRYYYRWIAYFSDQKINSDPTYGIDIGSENALAITLSPVSTELVDGRIYAITVKFENTGASTLNVDGLGIKQIYDLDNKELKAGELLVAQTYLFIYDGIRFILQNKSVVATRNIGEIYIGVIAPNDWNASIILTNWLLLDSEYDIGSASSGAHYASDRLEELFIGLWGNATDANCPVTGGRGASGASDWAANKRLRLPLAAGNAIGGYGVRPSITGRSNCETVGKETHTLLESELAAHNHIEAQSSEFPNWGRSTSVNSPRCESETGEQPKLGYTSTTGSSAAVSIMQPTTFYLTFIRI